MSNEDSNLKDQYNNLNVHFEAMTLQCAQARLALDSLKSIVGDETYHQVLADVLKKFAEHDPAAETILSETRITF